MAREPSKTKKSSTKSRGGLPVSAADLPASLRKVNLHAAGIDVGATQHYVAVPEERDDVTVRCFDTFTADLHALADWLERCGIDTVAMESTSVYWIPVFELLVERGFEVKLVEPGRLKNVPGRKTDVLDCQWIQQLHTYGLLQPPRCAWQPNPWPAPTVPWAPFIDGCGRVSEGRRPSPRRRTSSRRSFTTC